MNEELENKIKYYYLEKGITPMHLARRLKIDPNILKAYIKENNLREEKIKRSLKEKYGEEVINVGQLSFVKSKPSPFLNKEIQEKAKKVLKEKYGSTSYMNTKEFREKSKETCMKKYGVPSFTLTEQCINSNRYAISKINKKFSKFLEENNIKYENEYLISNSSYDFYLPDYNILIEVNPTFTHNSTYGPYIHNKQYEPKDKYYHYNKSKLARENGYICIHKFCWNTNNEILELIINIDKYKIVQSEPRLHWTKKRRSKENIINTDLSERELLNNDYVKIFDDGQEFILKQ